MSFEIADFVYRQNQMSAGDFNMLCKLWTATLMPHNDSPPFLNYHELCKMIDAMPIGGVAWQSMNLSYKGP